MAEHAHDATAYPLAWPTHRPRTPDAQRKGGNNFRSAEHGFVNRTSQPVQFDDARDRIENMLNRIGADLPVLSTNVQLRVNGRPKPRTLVPDDPGVALYFRHRGKPIVLACDRYHTVAANMAAIAAHLDATRTIERHGVGTLEQMFAGFTALPAPDDWREALGHPSTLAEAEAAYRERARSAHPDAGGSDEKMASLNAARAAARRELGGKG